MMNSYNEAVQALGIERLGLGGDVMDQGVILEVLGNNQGVACIEVTCGRQPRKGFRTCQKGCTKIV